MKLGLDTSVVVRLITGQPNDHFARARQRLEAAAEAGDEILLTDLVIGESYFVLRAHYGLADADVRRALSQVIRSGVFRVDPAEASRALDATGGAWFADRLIHLRYRALGATTLTFDRAQARLEGAAEV
jgi:predicted nucleic acid-binding protein